MEVKKLTGTYEHANGSLLRSRRLSAKASVDCLQSEWEEEISSGMEPNELETVALNFAPYITRSV